MAQDLSGRFWSKVAVCGADECWLWTASTTPNGYGQFNLGRRGLLDRSHRVAYRLAVGAIPGGLFVLHSCDVRKCCNPAHLHLGTHVDNMREMGERGRARPLGRGRLLTMLQAREIRAEFSRMDMPRRKKVPALARKYQTHPKSVRLILRGETYREDSTSNGVVSVARDEAQASKQLDDCSEALSQRAESIRERA